MFHVRNKFVFKELVVHWKGYFKFLKALGFADFLITNKGSLWDLEAFEHKATMFLSLPALNHRAEDS